MLVLALLVGAVMGSVRGALIDVHNIDTSTGDLLVQNTTIGVVLWLVAFAVRIAIGQIAGHTEVG